MSFETDFFKEDALEAILHEFDRVSGWLAKNK